LKILLAEDDPVTRRLVESQLRKWGHEIVVAPDGELAWRVLQRPDAPAIAVLDWVMPGMDGLDLCKGVRGLGREPYTYLILLTARGGLQNIVEGFEAGADDYIVKPFDVNELRVRIKTGERIVALHQELIAARAHLQGINRDLAEEIERRTLVEERLERARDELEEHVRERTAELVNALREKDVLLREIHHRVKNNLQIISSLLGLQSHRIREQELLDALMDSQGRIRSMALVHEQLYETQDLARIEFAGYARVLARSLVQSYANSSGSVNVQVLGESVYLEIQTAIPCGLILNELVSNCLKHAFPPGSQGEVIVEISQTSESEYTLVVSDNGKGIPLSLDFNNSTTLGLRLVKNLVESQLRGRLEVRRNKGTKITVVFSPR
jgi:two-component sensor histidine kinase